MEEQQQNAILKELSDIKSSLAVNTNETANIKQSVGEIKTDIREIKADYINRREFNDAMKSIREENPVKDVEARIRVLESFRWKLVGGLLTFQAIADFILYIVIKK